MFQDFFGPKVLKEPKKQWRVGRLDEFSMPGTVDETFKSTPAGSEGFWIVNLQPDENKLVAHQHDLHAPRLHPELAARAIRSSSARATARGIT